MKSASEEEGIFGKIAVKVVQDDLPQLSGRNGGRGRHAVSNEV